MRVLLTLMLLLVAPLALAADPLSIPAITLGTNAAGAQEYSVSLQILLIMTALSFIPAFVMLMTSFTRIIIVFSILRQALGLQQTPSNQILTGMALFLTLFIMAPVFDKVNQQALQPYLAEKMTAQDAIDKAQGPIKDFMLSQTRSSDLELFMRLSKRTDIATPDQAPPTRSHRRRCGNSVRTSLRSASRPMAPTSTTASARPRRRRLPRRSSPAARTSASRSTAMRTG